MRVYLDNAATTPLAPEVFEVMAPILKDQFGNPSSTHFYGRQTKAIIETSRRTIAGLLHCQPSEIVFTSGGTEADNMAINTAILDLGVERIITSTIEHHAVGHTVEVHKKHKAVSIDYVRIDAKGHVDLGHLEELLADSKKTLVSLMHANNEIATLLPLQKVNALCRKHGAYLHSDTVQTMGHIPLDLSQLDIDFVVCAAHKLHGPKGSGFLYINKHVRAVAFIHGGSQERGLRGGTENVAGIAGLAKAMQMAFEGLEEHRTHILGLKNYLIDRLTAHFPEVYFHGETDPERSLYTVLNVCLPKTEKASMLLFTLDLKGVAVSGGSACTSGATKGSHVLEGIGADTSRPNARFSFSRYTTKEEIDFALEQLQSVYSKTLA
jgi:cysteine desulfurase